jgi:hypothetical protein
MKHLLLPLSLSLVLVLGNIARADSFDSDAATVQKATDKTAKVTVDKKTFVVPVTFGDGASWDNVSDHYELSDASVALVKSGHASLTIGSDSSLSWKKK